jgi:large subunit ribosomal protein L22
MAEDKDTKQKDSAAKASGSKSPGKKAEPKKPAAKKPARTKAAATKTAAGSTAARKPAAKPKTETKSKPKTAAKPKTQAKPKTEAKPKSEARPKEAPKPPVVNARARYVRVAPRKARLIADQVRGMHVDDARTLLRFSTRGAARDIAKLIDSATANAEANHDLVADELRVTDITVDEGPTLRRYRPRALGRATRINKRTSHIHVALTPED